MERAIRCGAKSSLTRVAWAAVKRRDRKQGDDCQPIEPE
jgi:hypothetical protein